MFYSILILLLLGIMQIILIKPHYRNENIKNINILIERIEKDLLIEKNLTSSELNKLSNLINNSDVCVAIYNKNFNKIYSVDSLGEACAFEKGFKINNVDYDFNIQKEMVLDFFNDKDHINIYYNVDNDKEMMIQAKKVSLDYETYYIYINSYTFPTQSYLSFTLNQYYISIVIIGAIAIIFSYFLSNKFSTPIIKMKDKAKILSEGKYDVKFEGGVYQEFDVLAETLNDTTKKLSKVDSLRKELIANVSHDFKTPLTMIMAYAEMILDISGENKVKREEHLKVIIDEVKYLDKLVDDVSQLSKFESGQLVLTKSNFELDLIILKQLKILDFLIQEKQLKINLEIKETLVYADEIKIAQVVYNFLSNAIKFSKEEGEITIRLFDKGDRIRFEVEDDGIGIRMEDQPYVWERYYKIDKQFKRNLYQSGLGLAIVRAILESHQAKYGLISEIDKGSLFYFEILKEEV